MTQGKLFIITAPSGAGKTSLVSSLVANDPGLCVSVSHTTRPRRPGETDGVNYHFIDEAGFLVMLQHDGFLENAEVYGHRYGTSRQWVIDQLAAGFHVMLEIDWQGAAQIKRLYPDSCHIFILPPSLGCLSKRLQGRGQDDADTIAERMKEARSVIAHAGEADYIVVNDDFGRALADIQAIIRTSGLTTAVQQHKLSDLLTHQS